jgi:ribosomal protein L37AE/L43A
MSVYSEQRACDFCGRSAIDLLAETPIGMQVMERDEDGLWVCFHCRTKLVLPPIGEAAEVPEGLEALAGKSAGAICPGLAQSSYSLDRES